MSDYFSEYTSFVGQKSLPSPADTPYETPGFIRSKRSSRATAHSSREPSSSPPPLPQDGANHHDKSREGRYSAVDPRRFTPTLHASLVSEILNLRRELDSKNNLVENLETTLSSTKTENDNLNEQISGHAREARKAKHQVEQMEKGTYEALQDLVKERDAARQSAEDLRAKLELASKKARAQDEDAARTQDIWENEKESWESERRQLERRVHVTENRLRAIVDEMTAQQSATETEAVPLEDTGYESTFKDSAHDTMSDTASTQSMTPVKHRRNMSSLSYRTRSLRNSVSTRASTTTPEPQARHMGYNLADELDIDEEDEYDLDDFEHGAEELEYPEPKRRTMIHSRGGSVAGELDDAKAKRILGIADGSTSPIATPVQSPIKREFPKSSVDSSTATEPSRPSTKDTTSSSIALPAPAIHPAKPVEYRDTGYQPSPPHSPLTMHSRGTSTEPEQPAMPQIKEPESEPHVQSSVPDTAFASSVAAKRALSVATKVTASPLSPPETPVVDVTHWDGERRDSVSAPMYASASTQTDMPASYSEAQQPQSNRSSKRDSLQPPMFVPSIAIHPPNSRPASPRSYVLPPGTKNASAQTNLPWPGCDVAVQTEPIRIDQRLRNLSSLPQPTQRSPSTLLPSPTLPEPSSPIHPPRRSSLRNTNDVTISTKTPPVPSVSSPRSPELQSPVDSSPENTRDGRSKDKRNLPLKALPLPKPILAPLHSEGKPMSPQSPRSPMSPKEVKQEKVDAGPLNRSSQYGVTRPLERSSQLLDIDRDSEPSDYEDFHSDFDFDDLTGSIPAFNRAPPGRFGLSEPPKVVPEDKEISPDRRPGTAESYGAAPPPSISSSRANSHRMQHQRPPAKLSSYKDYRSRSPSFGSMASSSYSGVSALPPYPIPARSSSRTKPKTHSEGSQSPTPHHGNDVFSKGGHRSSRAAAARQNSLRKVQSAAAIRHASGRVRTSPQKPRRRRRSPDLTPVQSMAFETSPVGPAQTKFPIPELPTPLQERTGSDLVKGSVDLSNARPSTSGTMGENTNGETSLVDAIAATMVGEWMWKYIRKRKSFGIPDETAEFGQDKTNTHGTRHKRWVWLSPYERTIMWDTKQPTSGIALLGKKGRKLKIQSVLDVQDNTPPPKDAELGSAFNRSILILTNVRALKFTAVTQERHNLWMTALSFLAESGKLPQQSPPHQTSDVPRPPTPLDSVPIKRNRSPSFGRATIRDSVRLAKGRRPSAIETNGPVGATGDGEVATQDFGAEFPAVPRLYNATARHSRKRSNTSPRLPPPLNNIRSFSSSGIPSATSSRLLPGSSTQGSSFKTDWASSSSKSGVTSPDQPNFFEAVGTLRMEAFVDPNVRDGVLYVPAPPPSAPLAREGPRRRRRDSNLSQTTADKRRAGYVFDENDVDPFQGF